MGAVMDGGNAFPATNDGPTSGMSLRDWFAGQALAMLVDIAHHEDWSPARVAEMSYHCADAMLAARKGGGEA